MSHAFGTWIRLIRARTEGKIIAYHGTGSKFDVFSEHSIAGHYFTTNRNYALGYVSRTLTGPIRGPRKPYGYLLTVELSIDRLFDPATDPQALALYNEEFVPMMNAIRQKYHQPQVPILAAGTMVSFIHAADLYRYFLSHPCDYDGMLVDEGEAFGTALVPFNAAQIKIIKRDIIR